MDRTGHATHNVDALANFKQHVCDSGEVLHELLTRLQKEDDRLLEIKCGLELTWDAFQVPEGQKSFDCFPFILFELKFNGKKLKSDAQRQRREKIAAAFRRMVLGIDGRLHVSVFKSQDCEEGTFLVFDLEKCLDLVKSNVGPKLFEKGISNDVKSALQGIQTRLMKFHAVSDMQCQGFVKMFIDIILKNVYNAKRKRRAQALTSAPYWKVLHNHIKTTQGVKAKLVQDPEVFACKKYIMILLHKAGVVSRQVFEGFLKNSTAQVQSGSPSNGPKTPNEGEVCPSNGPLLPLAQFQRMNGDAKNTVLVRGARKSHSPETPPTNDLLAANAEASHVTGQSALLDAAREGRTDAVDLLITKGNANVDATDKHGATALMWAARYGHTKAVDLLITKGNANVDTTKKHGATALMVAARYGQDSAVDLLITKGNANVDATATDGWTALMGAARYGHANAVDLLITKGNANVDTTEKHGATALMVAARYGQDSAVDLLITKGNANVEEATAIDGITALIWADKYGCANMGVRSS